MPLLPILLQAKADYQARTHNAHFDLCTYIRITAPQAIVQLSTYIDTFCPNTHYKGVRPPLALMPINAPGDFKEVKIIGADPEAHFAARIELIDKIISSLPH